MLLDYLVYLLNKFPNNESYQSIPKNSIEIGMYLGVDKHSLNKIYKSLKGDWVRSKSEVIISNLLQNKGVNYTYEEKLFYDKEKWIEPDFTLIKDSTKYYWEHLGMLGEDEYDRHWK